jgi:hypothetical protein
MMPDALIDRACPLMCTEDSAYHFKCPFVARNLLST